VTSADCTAGDCLEVDVFGSKVCTEGKLGQPCGDPAQCASKHCRNGGGSSAGTCSDGAVGTACDPKDDADCEDGRCAQDSAGAGWTCSAGALGDRCSKPTHCVVGTCALASATDTDGYCTDGADQKPCKLDTQCQSMRCAVRDGGDGTCTTGAVMALCVVDDDCVSKLCAFSAGSGYGQCTAGMLKSACTDSGDCVQGTCAYSSGLGRGECTDGSLGAFCVTDPQCTKKHCVTGGNSAGICSAGTAGLECDNGQDCESGVCNNTKCQ
jgi:hypothetical protein